MGREGRASKVKGRCVWSDSDLRRGCVEGASEVKGTSVRVTWGCIWI